MLKVFRFFRSIDTQYILSYPVTTVNVCEPLFCYFFIYETKTLLIPGSISTLNLLQKVSLHESMFS